VCVECSCVRAFVRACVPSLPQESVCLDVESRVLIVLMDGHTHVPVVKRRGIKLHWGLRGKGEQEDKMRCSSGQTHLSLYTRAARDVAPKSTSISSPAARSGDASLFGGTCLWTQLPARRQVAYARFSGSRKTGRVRPVANHLSPRGSPLDILLSLSGCPAHSSGQ